MNILDSILNAQGGSTVQQLGAQLGLGGDQTASALSALVPALAAGFQRNIQSQGGLGNLISALSSGSHQQYLDNPATLGDQSAVDHGNGILGHVLGSKDVSRDVANQASAQTGIGADVLKQMLPLAATLMMGAFAKHSSSASFTPGLGGSFSGGGIASMLAPLLGQGQGGSIADNVSSMLGRFMGR